MKLFKQNWLGCLFASIMLNLDKVYSENTKDEFLKDTVRAELFTLTDYNVPDIYITMDSNDMETLFEQGSGGFGGGGKAPGNNTMPMPEGGFGGGGKAPGNNTMPMPEGGFGNGKPNTGNGGMPSTGGIKNPTTSSSEEFKANATLEFVINGEKTVVDLVSISVGGKSSKSKAKLGYNIKCDKGNLFGRKHFRIRPTVDDASFLRSKLSCDILNRLGLPSISANYARVFFNDQFMGLYLIMDIYKKSWVKQVYNDKEVSALYQCSSANSDFTMNNVRICVNGNDDLNGDTKPLEEFMTAIAEAQTREDLEDIMEVDYFIQVWIFEWLTGSWDSSLIDGKNYYLYKQITNGKWTILPYDFDSTFGPNMGRGHESKAVLFEDYYSPRYIVDVLTKNDTTSFVKNLQYVLDNSFNPDVLYPHINLLKEWLYPYIEEDRTPIDGVYPGYVNKKITSSKGPYSLEDFVNNCEYTDVGSYTALKKWIESRYKLACENYPVTCSSTIGSSTTIEPSSTTTIAATSTETIVNTSCWSEEMGYSCCSHCIVLLKDDPAYGVLKMVNGVVFKVNLVKNNMIVVGHLIMVTHAVVIAKFTLLMNLVTGC